MKELEGQVSHQLSPEGSAVQLYPERVGHNDTQSVVGVLAGSHQGGGGQVGISVLKVWKNRVTLGGGVLGAQWPGQSFVSRECKGGLWNASCCVFEGYVFNIPATGSDLLGLASHTKSSICQRLRQSHPGWGIRLFE